MGAQTQKKEKKIEKTSGGDNVPKAVPMWRRLFPALIFSIALVALVVFLDNDDSSIRVMPDAETRYSSAKQKLQRLQQVDHTTQAQWAALSDEFFEIYTSSPKWLNRPAALYRSAVALEHLGDKHEEATAYTRAVERYALLVKNFAASPLADDALLQMAHIQSKHLDDIHEALKTLVILQTRYPKGDMFKAANALNTKLQTTQKKNIAKKDATTAATPKKEVTAQTPTIKIPRPLPKVPLEQKKQENASLTQVSWATLDAERVQITIGLNKDAKWKLVEQKGDEKSLMLLMEQTKLHAAVKNGSRVQGSMLTEVRVAPHEKNATAVYLDFAKPAEVSARVLQNPFRIIVSAVAKPQMVQPTVVAKQSAKNTQPVPKERTEQKSTSAAVKKSANGAPTTDGSLATPAAPAMPTIPQVAIAPEVRTASVSPLAFFTSVLKQGALSPKITMRPAPIIVEPPINKADNTASQDATKPLQKAPVVLAAKEKQGEVIAPKPVLQESVAPKPAALKVELPKSLLRQKVEPYKKPETSNEIKAVIASAAKAVSKSLPAGIDSKNNMSKLEPTSKSGTVISESALENRVKGAQMSDMAAQLGLELQTVYLDIGHGGKDPGTINNGLVEREVVLDIGKKLGAILEAHDISVVYSRTKDVAVPLSARPERANAVHSDIFVSLHMNANTNTSVHGFETYYLDFAKTDHAVKVAMVENATSDRSLGDLQGILTKVMQNVRTKESSTLAKDIQKVAVESLRKEGFVTKDAGTRAAPFHVLIGAQMPAVLVEVGYCTHIAEAELLKRDDYRQSLALGIAKGILAYKKRLQKGAAEHFALTNK